MPFDFEDNSGGGGGGDRHTQAALVGVQIGEKICDAIEKGSNLADLCPACMTQGAIEVVAAYFCMRMSQAGRATGRSDEEVRELLQKVMAEIAENAVKDGMEVADADSDD